MVELVDFTTYENINGLIATIMKEQLNTLFNENQLDQVYSTLYLQCSQTGQLPPDFSQIFNLNCGDVLKTDRSGFSDLIVKPTVDSIYYRKFDCNFIDCIRQGNSNNLIVLISEQGNLFYRSLLVYLLVGTSVGLAMLLISIETWAGRLKAVGWSLVFTALPFVILNFIQPSLISSLPPEIGTVAKPIIDSLTSSLTKKFIIVLVIGLALLVVGYGLRFYKPRQPRKRKK